VGLVIANCRFPIADCFNPERPIDNRQLAIGTGKTNPLPRGGTDVMGPPHERLRVDHRRDTNDTFVPTILDSDENVIRTLANPA